MKLVAMMFQEQIPMDIAVNKRHDDCIEILLRGPLKEDGRQDKKRKK